MAIIIAIFVFLLVIGLSINTVKATENYNSAKSNTVTAISNAGVGQDDIDRILGEFAVSETEVLIDEELLKQRLAEVGINEDNIQRAVQKVREAARELLASKLPKAGLTPSSPFYFLERWTEAVGEFFTFSPQAKARLQVERALERLAEVQAMLAEEEVDAQGIGLATVRMEINLRIASQIVDDEKNKGQDVSALAKELDAQFGTQKIFLENLVEKTALLVPAVQKVRNTKIFESFDQADEKFEGGYTKVKIEVDEGKEGAGSGGGAGAGKVQVSPVPEKQPGAEQVEEETGDQGGAASAARGKDYNSSVSNTFTVGKIREEVGNILLRYGIGGAEINRVTEALERGIKESELRNLLSEIRVTQAGIDETLLKLDEMGAAFPSQ